MLSGEFCHFVPNGLVFSCGYVKRRNEHCCEAEYANVSLTHLLINQYVDGNPTDIDSMARNVSLKAFRLILVTAAHAHVTKLLDRLKV